MARFELLDTEGSPERTCIVTRAKASPQEMIRFVAGHDAAIVADIRRKLPGRGVWVMGHGDLVAKAVRRQAFSRGLKAKVVVSPNLAAEVESQLSRDCLQALSLANKAGQVITGFAKVKKEIASGAVAGLVHAEESGADGIRKLGQCLGRRFGDAAWAKPCIYLFKSGQLDLALGRTNVIHAALVGGAASEGFLDCCRRLKLYRSPSPQARGPDLSALRAVPDEELNGLPAHRHAETDWAGTQY